MSDTKAANTQTPSINLSLFATSDLHGRIMSFDYTKQTPSPKPSFAQIATLLETVRSETTNSLLFDNGDLIQGTPFADLLVDAQTEGMNMHSFLGLCSYDAATLGNHDFDFGPKAMQDTLDTACCPYVCANLTTAPFRLPPKSTILNRTLLSEDSDPFQIKIGVTGCLPQQTQDWVSAMGPELALSNPIKAITREVETLKLQGADIVIVLAHSGYLADPKRQEPENFAQILAQIDGVDAVFAGHLHYPDHSAPNLLGAPVAMAGCNASHVARIDLCLTQTGADWGVSQSTASTLPVLAKIRPHRDVMNIAQGIHRQTNTKMTQLIGQSKHSIHSFFARVAPSSAVQIIHNAQLWHLENLDPQLGLGDLPKISVAAAGRTGGIEGSDDYTFVPQGNLRLHHFFDIYRFENQVAAIVLSGADLINWLERSVVRFNTLQVGQKDQTLFDPQSPGYDFDTFYGLNYEIDLSKPAAFDRFGTPRGTPQTHGRIRNVTYRGQALDLAQSFLVGTNGFRTSRYGSAQTVPSQKASRDLLVDYVTSSMVIDPTPKAHWEFTKIPNTTANFTLPTGSVDTMPLPDGIELVQTQVNGMNIFRVRF